MRLARIHLMKKPKTVQRKQSSLANNDSLRLKIETSRNSLAKAADLDQKKHIRAFQLTDLSSHVEVF